MMEDEISVSKIVITAAAIVVGISGLLLAGCPRYDVYASEMSGRAKLAEAESSRQIAVREAQAKMDSASLLADADVARAKGVAQANQIIGQSLTGNEAYLRYLWIQNLENTKDQIIYVPTEGSLPILEASRFGKQQQ